MRQSDGALLARFPDPEAVRTFYARHVDSVLRFAVRRCGSAEDAADLVSLVFLELFDAAPSYDARRGDARPWLLAIATRCLADLWRRNYRGDAIERRLGFRPAFEDDEYERVEQMIDAARCGPRLWGALADALTDNERDMFLLVASDGLPAADAARSLGLAPVTGRMRLSRARRKLRSALGEDAAGALANMNGDPR